MRRRLFTLFLAAAAGLGAASPAHAQIGIGGGFTITGRGTVTTDFRHRGISRSDGDPALQATGTLSHDSGFYAGLWGSSLTEASPTGELQVEYYAGYAREIASGTDIDVGLVYTSFPDASALADPDYVEGYASLSHTLGPVTAEAGAFYAPEQDGLGGRDNLYLYGDVTAGIPFTPLTVLGRLGYSTGGLAPGGGDYVDWRLGVEVDRGPFRFGLSYVDTDLDLPNSDATVVASVSVGF
ncbi:TorF family putative porin [Sphingosinicella sp. YJ22]|uniref:TorF family putative porin n=1 Tax=Sphingosinicella sp. YJ22 TaxID=1104780 RepID=UPI00140D4F42|nr:TorF family putative porin [Sphingosinicella sp. YJ22]